MCCLLVENETLSSPALITAAGVLDAEDKYSVGGEGGGEWLAGGGLTPPLPGPDFCCTPAQGVTMMTAAGGQLTE